MSILKSPYFLLIPLFFAACGDGDNPVTPTTPVAEDLPSLSIEGGSTVEGNEGEKNFAFTIKVDGTYDRDIQVTYSTQDGSALAGMDYTPISETLTISSPATSVDIQIPIVSDNLREGNEHFEVLLNNPNNATISTAKARGLIQNDDTATNDSEEGYMTPDAYDLWKIKWADEFNGESVDTDTWTFELGNGCDRGLCGWGNNELQQYTDSPENVRIEDGRLVIEAKQEGTTSYSSTRMITQDKQELRFGRIDIRAKLPKGQGIWPAIWMLGANIDDVGWPACGEIDIMELLGHEPNKVHGTAHWDQGGHTFQGGDTSKPTGDFNQEFHVFSIIWDETTIRWLIDDEQYYIQSISAPSKSELVNNNFFFIFNVAVGGLWPGNPDATTKFPQRMIVDYIRVFQDS